MGVRAMDNLNTPSSQPENLRQPSTQSDQVASRATAGGEVHTYEAPLYGGTVEAVPSRADADGQRVWTVTATTEDGRQAQVEAKLTGQFGREHLEPGSYVKDALNRQLGVEEAGAQYRGATAQAEGGGGSDSEEDGSVLSFLGRISPDGVVAGKETSEGRVQFLKGFDANVTMFETRSPVGKVPSQFGQDSPIINRLPGINNIRGVNVNHVSATILSPGSADSPASREEGIGIATKGENAPLRLSANIRGGDISAAGGDDRVRVTVTIEAMPAAVERIASKLPTKLAETLEQSARMTKGSGVSAGAYYSAELVHKDNGELHLVAPGQSEGIALTDLLKQTRDISEEMGYTNEGAKTIAQLNNFDQYYEGANPYNVALYTRQEGQFVNHGDPVSDLAARLIQIHDYSGLSEGDGDAPMTNQEAANGLIRAIRTDRAAPAAGEYQQLLGQDQQGGSGIDPAQRLTPQQSEHLHETLALLHEYGISSLFGDEVQEAAAQWADEFDFDDRFISGADKELAQNVFEGQYRSEAVHWLQKVDPLAIASSFNLYAAVSYGIVDGGSVAESSLGSASHGSHQESVGFYEYAQSQGVSPLDEIGVDPMDPHFRQFAHDMLPAVLNERLRDQGDHEMANAATLTNELQELSAAEKDAVRNEIRQTYESLRSR